MRRLNELIERPTDFSSIDEQLAIIVSIMQAFVECTQSLPAPSQPLCKCRKTFQSLFQTSSGSVSSPSPQTSPPSLTDRGWCRNNYRTTCNVLHDLITRTDMTSAQREACILYVDHLQLLGIGAP